MGLDVRAGLLDYITEASSWPSAVTPAPAWSRRLAASGPRCSRPATLAASSRSSEAHLLSLCYADLGLPTGGCDRFVKRLWTQPLRHQNVQPGAETLALWHLPAEKRYGLRRLYGDLVVRDDGFESHLRRGRMPPCCGAGWGCPRTPASKAVRRRGFEPPDSGPPRPSAA